METPPLNVADYARAARAKLPKEVYDYYEGGALDEITLRENTAGWAGLKLYYRVLAGVGAREMETTRLGQSISMPIAVAPPAVSKLACAESEITTARSARPTRTWATLSSPPDCRQRRLSQRRCAPCCGARRESDRRFKSRRTAARQCARHL